MTLHIAPTTRQDCQQAAKVLGRAFADEPVSLAVYHKFSPEKRVRALSVDFSAELKVCLRKGCPVHIEREGQVAAAAIIYPPGTYPLPWYDQWMFLFKSVWGNGWYDVRKWLRWLEEVDTLHPTEAHYYLEYIGVDPHLQGMGLGSYIMDDLVSKADQAGVGCYLENASPRNLPFYTRFGFQVVKEKEIIGFTTWFMWRKPK
jgi:GNAT superfamily N-acetyltransferase